MNARSSLDNIFEIAALFPSPARQEKNGGNFKTSMRFKGTNPLSSYIILALGQRKFVELINIISKCKEY